MAEELTADTKDYERWRIELEAATKRQKDFHKEGGAVTSRYRDERKNAQGNPDNGTTPFRINLFHANVQTTLAMMYGKVPQTDVGRRFADPDDDTSRISSEILQRMLDMDIQVPGSTDTDLLRHVLKDRLLPGLACARIRYDFETESTEQPVLDPATGQPAMDPTTGQPITQQVEKVTNEEAPLDYVHWRDFRWGYGRIWAEVPWVSFDVYMTEPEATKRFGAEIAKQLEYTHKPVGTKEEEEVNSDAGHTWLQAQVTEIWDKKTRQVMWWSADVDKLLDKKDDTLKLRGFFPCPPPWMANCTTDLVLPRADFMVAQDLYNQIDVLQTRIGVITKAVKVIGLYDSKADGVKRMFQEGTDNDLIPVDNWAMFAEKGGIAGAVDWFPVAEVAETLSKLQELRDQSVQLLYQVTGMSDILRGQSEQYAGVGQEELKAKFASVRLQHLQDEFSRFVSDLMDLRAEVIRKHYNPESIYVQSNAQLMQEDQQAVEAAVQFLKSDGNSVLWKVEIKPESISLIDHAQMKMERIEYLTALGSFLQSANATGEVAPELIPMLMGMMKWALAAFKGANQVEGLLDKGMEAMQQKLEQAKNAEPPPNPKIQEIEAKAQAESQKTQQKAQAESQKLQEKAQAEMNKLYATHMVKIAEIAKVQDADARIEAMQAYFNIMEVEANKAADLEVKKFEAQNRRATDG